MTDQSDPAKPVSPVIQRVIAKIHAELLEACPIQRFSEEFLGKPLERVGKVEQDGIEYDTVRLLDHRRIRVEYATGLLIEYQPVHDAIVFGELDQLFFRALMEELSHLLEQQLYHAVLFETRNAVGGEVDPETFFHLMGHISTSYAREFLRDPSVTRYLLWATGSDPQHRLLKSLSSARAFLDLVREVSQSSVEDRPVRAVIGWFKSKQQVRMWTDGDTMFSEPLAAHKLTEFRAILPLAGDGAHMLCIVRNRVVAVSRTSLFKHYEIPLGHTGVSPVIVRFFGAGHAEVLAPRGNRLNRILTIFNGRPQVRDPDATSAAIVRLLTSILSDTPRSRLVAFGYLVVELSAHRKGASILISHDFPDLVASVRVRTRSVEVNAFSRRRDDASAKLHYIAHTFSDGAVCLDHRLRIVGFAAILPIQSADGLPQGVGARHISAASYTNRVIGCVAVVVSQDGPISVFYKGGLLMRS
jgi:hypothetical protein